MKFDTTGYTIERRNELTAVISLPMMNTERGDAKQIVVSVRAIRDDKFATSTIVCRDYNKITHDSGALVGVDYVTAQKMTTPATTKNMVKQFELILSEIDTHLEHITKFYNEQVEAR
jgi:hypothetical protein